MVQPDVTIDILQDDVLLEIFDSYRKLVIRNEGMWDWQKLLHVCRRWRYIVLASPRHLNLQIECGRSTPTIKLLDIWPRFPISIYCDPLDRNRDNHNILAALQQRDRISQIDFSYMAWQEMEPLTSAMDGPFPVLTHLRVRPFKSDLPAELPDSFLGGSAPRLESFVLWGIAFPALPNLVLSATHFRHLHLLDIPHTGYIPPEVMVTFLLPLHNLKRLTIGFDTAESRPLQMSPPPSTRALLPSLSYAKFDAAGEYSVDFITRIDTPMLDKFGMEFYSDIIPNISPLHKFIDRIDRPKTFTHAKVLIRPWDVQAMFESPAGLGLNFTFTTCEAPLVSTIRLIEQLLTIPSQVEQLELHDFVIEEEERQDEIDDSQWLQLLNIFVSVKSLYVSEELGPFIAFALEELTGERVTEVLPALDNLFFGGLETSGFVEETIESFVTMRQLSGHPVSLRRWELESA
jgi:hypothetical protein